MTWRSDLIAGMTRDEARTLLAAVAGGRPDVFDWAAESLGGTFAERFGQARTGDTEASRCRTCGGLIDGGYTDPYDGKTPRWRHLVLPGAGTRETASFLDEDHSAEPRSGEVPLVAEPYRTPQGSEAARGDR
ncbi:MAG TPA: hypothetical protein VFB06_29420 [Streptosporangiaceae bacterium]|nr:hypothetical protein [Streptosporangiaceae bacterium]